MHEARLILKEKPNILEVNSNLSQQVTICGDLHGQLTDLLILLYKVTCLFIFEILPLVHTYVMSFSIIIPSL